MRKADASIGTRKVKVDGPAIVKRSRTGPADSYPTQDVIQRRQLPWLVESSPHSWDSYAMNGGPDYLLADCGSPQSHERRLRAILKLPLRAGHSLLEFGCGSGRLADLLPEFVAYEGLDWSGKIIAEARNRRPGHIFRQGSVADLSPHDWIVASGPFNYATGWSKEQTAEVVAAMWHASRCGIAVTVLSTAAEDRLYYTPAEILSFLPGEEWSQMQVDQSYLPNDICIRAWR